MIPPFDDNGYLPAGIHPATLAEIEVRFGTESELRRAQMQSLVWVVPLARQAGVKRLVIDGSFVTDTFEPNDIDCILLVDSNYPHDASAIDEIVDRLPFLDMHLVEQFEFIMLVDQFFATDRHSIPKGLVEVIL